MPQNPGTILLKKYRIETRLGGGAFGDVYRVTDLKLEVQRVVKILKRRTPGMSAADYDMLRARFELEARLGAQLNNPTAHPRLLQIFALHSTKSQCVLEMEYAPGGNLAERIQKYHKEDRPVPLDEALRIAAELAEGLAALHDSDIVHRDVKPANILFDAQGHARLADLGLAQANDRSLRDNLSETLAPFIPGTLAYMSPEQISTRGLLTPSSDIYSLGLVLFEMLTGRNYSLQEPGTRASHLRADLPAEVDDLLVRMLSESPKERPWNGEKAAGLLREAEEKRRKELLLELAPGVTMEFVRVPAGEFLMGSDPNKDKQAESREQPQHKVRLDEYLIGKYPVTNRQYQAFTQASGHKAPGHWENGKIPAGKENHPVVRVSWQAAADFCAWVSQISGARVRLPSEAEWEKAARGTDGRIYPWGDQALDAQRCNFNHNVVDTTPVGQYSPVGDSPFGCADLAGNVWEWAADWFDGSYYGKSPASNPAGPESGTRRVLRGGSWSSYDALLRSALRDYDGPAYTSSITGFRCARSR